MSEFFSVMMWPLIASLLLPPILVYLGLHIVRREIIFVDLALAQVAALGTCLGILLGHEANSYQSYLWSVGFTLVGAIIFTLTRSTKRSEIVHQEALIGIVYAVAAASGILLLSRSAEGNEELRRTLIGDLLLVSPGRVLKTFALYAVIGLIHYTFRRKFMMISFVPEQAMASGVSIRQWDFMFYVLFGFVVTSFVQIGGVLLAFSYLIVPAVCANFLARSFKAKFLVGCVTAAMASVLGLSGSYRFDLPTGAAVVCTLGLALIVVLLAARFMEHNRSRVR